jgi:hypothetical protein
MWNEESNVPLEETDSSVIREGTLSANGIRYQSFIVALINLLNTLIGPEILCIANSMIFCGVYISVCMMAFTAIISYIATGLILNLQRACGACSINEMATKIVGRWFGQVFSGINLCLTFSNNVAYLVVGSQQVCDWIRLAGPEYEKWTHGFRRSLVVLIYALSLPIALSIPPQMTFIDTASMFAIIGQIFFAKSVIIRSVPWFQSHQAFNPTCESAKLDIGFFNAFAIYSTLFALPSVVLPQLEPFSPKLGSRYSLIMAAFFCAFLIDVIPSTVGYLRFGKNTNEILVHSFLEDNRSDVLMEFVNFGFFLISNACYVIVSLQIMTDLGAMIYNEHDPKRIKWKRRIPLLFLTNIVPLCVAMILPSVRPAFEIGGAFGGCLSNFFFPAVLYWWYNGLGIWHWKSLLLGLLALFGLISMIFGTYEAIIDAVASFNRGRS